MARAAKQTACRRRMAISFPCAPQSLVEHAIREVHVAAGPMLPEAYPPPRPRLFRLALFCQSGGARNPSNLFLVSVPQKRGALQSALQLYFPVICRENTGT